MGKGKGNGSLQTQGGIEHDDEAKMTSKVNGEKLEESEQGPTGSANDL